MHILVVAGNWAENIKQSGYVNKLAECMHKYINISDSIELHNGGTFDELNALTNRMVEFDIVLWIANVPNTYDKIVNQLKVNNPKMILVTSKNNLDRKYSKQHLIARMLKVKANLCLEFTKSDQFLGTLLDPLGNAYIVESNDIDAIAAALVKRAYTISKMTRIGSIRIGDAIDVPDQPEFFVHAKNMAETFHSLIHPEATERFLGNLSFRCERGFPSFRTGDGIFVSKRNIDKRFIDRDGFVGVESFEHNELVKYYGDNKPSVDTPIQLALYKAFPSINYMMHAHVYVEKAPFTYDVIPCGSFEEVGQICLVASKINTTNFSINLLGHGSIVFANSIDYMKSIKYYARPLPETHS